MRYFKNAELTRRYNVSDKAVRNWIDSARHHKNDLKLYSVDGTDYIADTIQNAHILANLVAKGRKYVNHRNLRVIEPKQKLYTTFRAHQVMEIVNELDKHRELPGHYKYFGEGAAFWQKYLTKLRQAGSGNLLTNTLEVLQLSLAQIDSYAQKYKHINLINLCVGNSASIESLLPHLQQSGKLKRVILIDISQDMLDISKATISGWGYQLDTPIETYIRDLSHEKFDDIIMQSSFDSDAADTLNLVLMLAGPIVNFKRPSQALCAVNDSLSKNDMFILSLKCDTEETRNFFDFTIPTEDTLISGHDSYLLDLLNISPDYYEPEQYFDSKKRTRQVSVKLRVDLTINFSLKNFTKKVQLKKGESIILWKARHHTDEEISNSLRGAGFKIISLTKSQDEQLNLLITRPDSVVT